MLVFAPHPDDETLGCGGTILKKQSEGHEVIVVVLTDGRNAFLRNFGIVSDPTPQELKQVRRQEVANAARRLNITGENLFLFDFEDGALQRNKAAVTKKISEVMETISPAEVYFPYVKDSHCDHQEASKAIQDYIRGSNFSGRTYQYTIAPWSLHFSPVLERFTDYLRHDLLYIDVSQFLVQKLSAIREYRSQITLFAKGQKKPIVHNVEFYLKGKELFHVKS
jgi:LmbE family N-acetylglucosaminyl deacetylase